MKKLIVLILTIGLMSVCALNARGAVISENTVDTMHDTAYWYSNSTTSYGLGNFGLTFTDPLDPGDIIVLERGDANAFSWSYKADTGKTFGLVQVSVLGRGWGETAALTYIVAGGEAVALAPTSSAPFSTDQWGSGSRLDTYDFTSQGLAPNEITFTLNYWEYYMPMIGSVSLEVIPEPASLALLGLGGLCGLRRPRR